MTPYAPSAAASSARRAALGPSGDEIPTVTRAPLAIAVSVTTRRSSSDSAPASPIVPHTTTSAMPRSTSRRALAASRSAARERSSSNGVSSAGITERNVTPARLTR
jgi:hypothetical protein